MGLNLKGVPIAPKQTKERSQRAFDVLEAVQEQMRSMGLDAYPRPHNAPEPLGDIDHEALSNRELEKQFTHYVAYGAYVSTKLAEAEVALRISKTQLDALIASLKVSLFKDEVPKGEVMARVKASPEYAEAELEHLKLLATKEILAAHHNAYRVQAQALSRVVEIRKLEYEQEQRQSSIGSYKRSQGVPGKLRGQ